MIDGYSDGRRVEEAELENVGNRRDAKSPLPNGFGLKVGEGEQRETVAVT